MNLILNTEIYPGGTIHGTANPEYANLLCFLDELREKKTEIERMGEGTLDAYGVGEIIIASVFSDAAARKLTDIIRQQAKKKN